MRVLVLAPHCDDGELGAGATLAKFSRRGDEIIYLAFTDCDNPILHVECEKSIQVLGFASALELYKFPVRRFSEHRQDILQLLVDWNIKLKPDYVFCPSSSDTHNDHCVIYQEAIRAFKTCNVLGYECLWNALGGHRAQPSEITSEQLELKVSALACYESQKWKDYFEPDFTRGLAKIRGVQFKCGLAEIFEVIRYKL